MSDDLDRKQPTDLAEISPQRELGAFDVLDVYEGGVAPEEPRIEALATISAGYKNDKGFPVVSRDNTIHLHDPEGRAPALAAALEATGGKTLTITFPFDDPQQFIQQRFVQYSKTRLLAYGDQHSITLIDEKGNRKEIDAHRDPDAYRAAVANCSTAFSVYFNLVEFQGDSPVIVMPDGMGFYRIRFTGRNSARAFMGQMRLLTKFTNGRIAGVPFELRLVNREVADPTGARRTIPVFTPTVKIPGMRLDSTNFRNVLTKSIDEADRLQLAPPRPETIEDAEEAAAESANLDDTDLTFGPETHLTIDVGDAEDPAPLSAGEATDPEDESPQPTAHDVAVLTSELDYDSERARFFAVVDGTRFEGEADRAALLRWYFYDDDGNPRFEWVTDDFDASSLRDVIARIPVEDWDAFLADVEDLVERQREIAGLKIDNAQISAYAEGVTEKMVGWLEDTLERLEGEAAFDYRNRLPFLAWLLGHDPDALIRNDQLRPEAFEELRDRLGVTLGAGKWRPLSPSEAAEIVGRFEEWRTSDATIADALG